MMVFQLLDDILTRPDLFATMTTVEMWSDPHISERMLRAHLDPTTDAASRRPETIDRQVAWLASRFGLARGRSVLDLGCGPGLYAARLARIGARVVGVDVSGRSLEYARAVASEENLAIRYIEADYMELPDVGRYDLVTLIWCDYGAMSPDQRVRFLRTVSSSIEPDGRLVLDVFARAAFGGPEEVIELGRNLMGGFWAPKPYFGFHTSHRWNDEFVTLDRYDVITATDHRTFYSWTSYFDEASLTTELQAAGFEVEDVIGDFAGSEPAATQRELAVVARLRR